PLVSFNSHQPVDDTHPFFHELKSTKKLGFVGELNAFSYALLRDTEGDLHVHLRSKRARAPQTKDDDWKSFHAFMKALAFVHGVNAWPYRIEYWRDGQKLTDRIMNAGELGKTAHAPFTEALGFNARVGQVK